jgi:hypothetical protein
MARKSLLWVLLLLALSTAAVAAYFGWRYHVGSETPPSPKPLIPIELPNINVDDRSDATFDKPDTVDKKGPKGLADYCSQLGDVSQKDPACK